MFKQGWMAWIIEVTMDSSGDSHRLLLFFSASEMGTYMLLSGYVKQEPGNAVLGTAILN